MPSLYRCFFRRGLVSLFSIAMIGCSHTSFQEVDKETQTKNLSQSLGSLSTQVLGHEATEVSNVLINTAISLSDEYDMMHPALYHNMLVNMGLRDRGLCCHWAEDLQAELHKLKINSLKVAWLIARQGNQLREHNSIVIYAEDNSWQEGIVFDPWRKAGVPFWTTVAEDEYPWKLHPLNGRWNVLRCK